MEISQNIGTIFSGFMVLWFLAPRATSPYYGQLFLAYMVALLFIVVGTADLIMIKPTAFFFMVGGSVAFLLNVFMKIVRFSLYIEKK